MKIAKFIRLASVKEMEFRVSSELFLETMKAANPDNAILNPPCFGYGGDDDRSAETILPKFFSSEEAMDEYPSNFHRFRLWKWWGTLADNLARIADEAEENDDPIDWDRIETLIGEVLFPITADEEKNNFRAKVLEIAEDICF